MFKILSRYLEKWSSFYILKIKNGHFSRCSSLRFLYFSDFQILSDFGASKVFRVIFRVLDENLPKNMYHATQTWDFQFVLFLTPWPWMSLTFYFAFRKLGMVLRSIPDTIHDVLWLISIWSDCIHDKTKHANRQTFWIWPDLWRHRWPRGQQH